VFAERRQRFLDALGPDSVAILIGARLANRSADTEFPFRQDSDFWYLTGFDQPDAIAVFRTDGGPAFSLFVQPRDRAAETWTGVRPGVEGAVERYGADEAHPCGEFEGKLPSLLERARHVYHVLGRREEIDRRIVAVQEELRTRTKLGFAPAADLIDPRHVLHEMRLFKTAEEIELMRRAAAISAEAHQRAAEMAQPGNFEYQLEAELLHVFRGRGGSGPAYGSIVGGGHNAAILHYVTNDQPLAKDTMVLIDAGAELEGYASDVTRTYPVGGRFTGAGRAVYEVVLAAQEAALAECRPGSTLPRIHEAAVRTLIEGMVSLQLVEGTVDDIFKAETYKPWYMHGTSHWLGLDVHDVGAYTSPDSTADARARDGKPDPRKLEPGMVFTVEPGLYVREDDEKAPESLRGIGVRIEDDVVITDSGFENLNSAIPKRIPDVEAWVRGKS
jgi:Xaa-Pro aminopeptidase